MVFINTSKKTRSIPAWKTPATVAIIKIKFWLFVNATKPGYKATLNVVINNTKRELLLRDRRDQNKYPITRTAVWAVYKKPIQASEASNWRTKYRGNNGVPNVNQNRKTKALRVKNTNP